LIEVNVFEKKCAGSKCPVKRNVVSIKGGPMKYNSVLLTAAFAIVVSAAHAQDKPTGAVPAQELKAKTDYCKTCHGVSAQGFRGAFPMPRLAGQQPEYLKNQLSAFIERRRTNPVMFNVAHVLSPPMLTALSTYFQELNPKPLGAVQRSSSPPGNKFTKKAFPKPRFLHALRVTGRMPRAPMPFPVWQVSFMTTSSGS
jgi:cytochrome c553